MPRWEYFTIVLDANPLKAGLPKQPGRSTFDVNYLKPQLDAYGAEGWELLSVQPVEVGVNGDLYLVGSGRDTRWAHEYFCTFKRPL